MTLAVSTPELLVPLTALVGVGALVQWIAARTRLPAVVLLLVTGLLIGPVTGLVEPRALFGDLLDPLITLSVGFVLFEGGLSLKLREARRLGAPLLRLVGGGLIITFVAGTLAAHAVGGLSWATAATAAAVLIVTGPTVIRPMLRQARLPQRPARLLKWEGIVNDPLGALLAVAVVEIVAASSATVGDPTAWDVPVRILGAAVLGGGGGYLLGRALDTGGVPEHLKTPTTVAAVALVLAGGETLLHEAGLLATTTMGVVLANSGSPNLGVIRRFKEDITTLLVALLFVVLAARLEISQLTSVGLREFLFVLAVLVVVRPLAVFGSLAGTEVPWRERLLLGWIAPRGVVAAAMAAALTPRLADVGVPDADRLVPVLFAVVIATVGLHGLTLGPLARRLKLTGGKEPGLLVVGGSRWADDLARALGEIEVEAVIVDANHRRMSRSRIEGIEAYHGEVLDQHALDDLPTERLGMALAASNEDHYNALASVALVDTFGREHVAQLTPYEARDEQSSMQGRLPWQEPLPFSMLAHRYRQGARFSATRLTEEFDRDAFAREHPDAIVLLVNTEDGLQWPADVEAEAGVTLVHLSKRDEDVS